MILQNAARRISTGEIIVSTHRHDYVSFFENRIPIFSIDGGYDCIRVVGDLNSLDFELLSIDEDTPIKEQISRVVWGSTRKDVTTYKLMVDLTTTHLENIKKWLIPLREFRVSQNYSTNNIDWRLRLIELILQDRFIHGQE